MTKCVNVRATAGSVMVGNVGVSLKINAPKSPLSLKRMDKDATEFKSLTVQTLKPSPMKSSYDGSNAFSPLKAIGDDLQSVINIKEV